VVLVKVLVSPIPFSWVCIEPPSFGAAAAPAAPTSTLVLVYDRSIHESSESLELNSVDELYGNDHAPQLNYLFGNKTGIGPMTKLGSAVTAGTRRIPREIRPSKSSCAEPGGRTRPAVPCPAASPR
jgi:hypothetical protein